MSHFLFLQCDTDCAKGDQDFQDTGEHTPHLLSHTFTGTNADKMREIVTLWKNTWRMDISLQSLGDYKKFIKKKYSKFDELALMLFALGSKSHICVIFRDDTMWTMCESGSKDDCDIIFLYHGNLFFDEVEEVDGDEPEKEDYWVPTEEDYEHEKEDMELEREGIEGEEFEQDIDIEGVEQKEEETEKITT